MKTLFASLLTLCMASTAQAAYVPVVVSYTVTGSPGDYTMDFTFRNNLINSQNAPGDWTFYRLGLSLPDTTIVDSPLKYNVSPAQDEYNHVWRFDNYANDGNPPGAIKQIVQLYPQTELSGFLLHTTALAPPSIASFFMTGSAQPDNGRQGFHSGGRYQGLTVATLKGIANGTIIESPRGLTPVPIPGAVVLFGSGLAALAGWQLKRKHQRLSAAI